MNNSNKNKHDHIIEEMKMRVGILAFMAKISGDPNDTIYLNTAKLLLKEAVAVENGINVNPVTSVINQANEILDDILSNNNIEY